MADFRRAVKEVGDKASAKVKVDADTKPAAAKVKKLADTRINLRADSRNFIRDAGKAAASAASLAGSIFTARFFKSAPQGRLFLVAHHNSLQLMQHKAV